MNALAQFIGVDSLTPNKLMTMLKLIGIKLPFDDAMLSLLQDVIDGVAKSGRYQTLADVLADEALLNSLSTIIHQGDTDADTQLVDVRSLIKCPKCGARFTIKSLQRKDSDEV